MTTIVLFGITGGKISDEIIEILKPYGIINIRNNSLYGNGENPEYIILECTARANIEYPKGIIVMTGEAVESHYLKLPEGFKGIVHSGDKTALKLLYSSGIRTVSCGMSGLETVIFSSISKNGGCISLQRKITTLSGITIEPFEYPIHFDKQYSDYSIMASFSILLMTDNLPNKW